MTPPAAHSPAAHTGDEFVAFLEPDQLVAHTSRRVPPARLRRRTRTALWALRIFVVLVSLMVIYTFITQLS